MRRITAFFLLLALVINPLHAAPPVHSTPIAVSSHTSVGPMSWIVPFFARTMRDWLIGKALDYGYDRVRLATLGEDAARHCSDLRGIVALSARDRQTLTEAEAMYRMLAATLARGELPDHEARRRIAALDREMDRRLEQITSRLADLERRIHALEREQQRQYRILVDLQGRIVRLENGLYDLDGRLVQQGERIDALYHGLMSVTVDVASLQQQLAQTNQQVTQTDQRVDSLGTVVGAIRDIVEPDPHRFLRFGTYLSLYGMYVDATAMTGDGSLGIGVSVQANLTRRVGVFGEAVLLPIKATDGAAPDGSPLEWMTFPVMLGFAFDLLPPQSPLSIQLSAGGGISYSSLRYYPEDYDPELGNWTGITEVTGVVGTAKIEIGAAPLLSEFEPVLTVGYMGLQKAMHYSDGQVRSNAGRELLYLSLGARLRTNLPGQRNR